MLSWKKSRWPVAAGIGLAVGLVWGGLLPNTPLHAVSTDRADTYAIATGPVDTEVEALYLLDFLTGDLGAFVLGKQAGIWSGRFVCNVARDLGVDSQKNPQFMMVTGIAGLRRFGGSRQQPSSAVCYVAEVTSGRLAAYAIPWSVNQYNAGQQQGGPLRLVGVIPFRPAAGAGPGTATGAVKGREEKE